MWKFPWGIKEGFAICAGLLVTGTFLNLLVGNLNLGFLCFPTNLGVAIGYLFLLVFIHWYSTKNKILKWFSGHEAAVTSITSFLFLVLVMGFIRQSDPNENNVSRGLIDKWGFTQMVSSWAFILMMVYLISVLGLVTIRRISRFRWKKDISFVLNHAGLFITLLAAILGSSDFHRLQMVTTKGNAEWRAMDENQRLVELPLAIELDSFGIEEYAPKLMLVDPFTGQTLPKENPLILTIEKIPLKFDMMGWQIEVEKMYDMAGSIDDTDTTRFVEYHSPGATTAILVSVFNPKKNIRKKDWISCGSYLFPLRPLALDSNLFLVMPQREPKKFTSKVTVFCKNGQTFKSTIEVNKPFKIKGWNIYQLSYDEEKGKWSTVSILELVRDPWLPLVYAGFAMMIAGAVALLFGKRKQDKDGVE
jgi:hypothetical protein